MARKEMLFKWYSNEFHFDKGSEQKIELKLTDHTNNTTLISNTYMFKNHIKKTHLQMEIKLFQIIKKQIN